MSRLCRLKTKTHGEDGQWAYEEITKLHEQVVAQAAVIESLKRAIGDWDRAETPSELQSAEAGLLKALATPTDSTQILDEVRRAERERVITLLNASFGYLADYDLHQMSKAIQAMEWMVKTDIVERLTMNAQWLHRDGFDTSANNAIDAKAEILSLRQRVAELEKERDALRIQYSFGKSKDIHSLAEIILTDCGCSTVHNRLLDKVENRLWSYFDEQCATLAAECDALNQQRDELLAAAEAIEIDAEECLDFDECTAMLVPIGTYHKLVEAIASVKEKPNVQD